MSRFSLRLRRRIRLLPGVHVNIGKRGVSSLSLGPRGLGANVALKGAKATRRRTPTTLETPAAPRLEMVAEIAPLSDVAIATRAVLKYALLAVIAVIVLMAVAGALFKLFYVLTGNHR